MLEVSEGAASLVTEEWFGSSLCRDAPGKQNMRGHADNDWWVIELSKQWLGTTQVIHPSCLEMARGISLMGGRGRKLTGGTIPDSKDRDFSTPTSVIRGEPLREDQPNPK